MNWAERTRRNHALEHATIALLIRERDMESPLAGNSTPGGFFIYGRVDTEEVRSAVEEALRRLSQGEEGLAVSPFCGTNLVVGAFLAALGAIAALDREKPSRGIPRAVFNALGGLLAAKPLGRLAQRYITTSADVARLEVTHVVRWGLGPLAIHRVHTRFHE